MKRLHFSSELSILTSRIVPIFATRMRVRFCRIALLMVSFSLIFISFSNSYKKILRNRLQFWVKLTEILKTDWNSSKMRENKASQITLLSRFSFNKIWVKVTQNEWQGFMASCLIYVDILNRLFLEIEEFCGINVLLTKIQPQF